MQLRRTPILLSMVITMTLLFGGWFLYQKLNVEQPIREQVESMSSAKVEQLAVEKDQVVLQLSVTDPALFPTEYRDLEQAMMNLVPNRRVQIQIVNKTSSLHQVWENGLFALTEAVETRRYGQIPALLDQWREAHGLDEATSRMDESHIYIYLKRGSDSFFEVVPRIPAATEESGVTVRV